MNILWQGARGITVKELQTKLKERGYDPGDTEGIFGPSTRAAVVAFQRDMKLFADGIAGPQTLKALQLRVAPPVAPDAARPSRDKLFISYSHADEKWLQMLQVHLAPLERDPRFVRWDDSKIKPGDKWRHEIDAAIRSTKVAVLLVSPEFLASDFIANNELPPLLTAAKHEGTVILPVIISPCIMGNLSEFQSVNPPSKPLVDLSRGDRDRVWVKVVEAITAALNE